MGDSGSTPPAGIAVAEPVVGPLSYDMRGYRVSVDVPDPDAARLVGSIFRAFECAAHPNGAGSVAYELRRDGQSWRVSNPERITYRTEILADALLALEWQLVTDMIAHRRDCFHLHAAALLSPAVPAALVVAGMSGSGKTTLTLGLMARGFLPYSDDTTLIDPDTCAPTAFRRSFHVDVSTRSLLANLPAPPDWDFDAAPAGYFSPPRWAEDACPIRTVLFPTLAPGAAPALAPLTIAEAAARLLPFSATLAQSPPLALRTAARIVAGARCYDLVAGSFDDTLDLVIERFMRDHG